MTAGTTPWVAACYKAIDYAVAGKDPSDAVAHLPEMEADRALHAALPIIERVAWVSDQILQTPGKGRRKILLERYTRKNRWMRRAVEARVRRRWKPTGDTR